MSDRAVVECTRVARSCLMRSPAARYVHELRPHLPVAAWKPASSRLLWLPVHIAVVVVATLAISKPWLPWPVLPVLSLLIGCSFAGLMFLGHEVMHGAVVRGRRARLVVGGLCFAPLAVSPHLWIAWHNGLHHAHANRIGVDPDMYPSLSCYQQSAAARFVVDHFAPGARRWRGLLTLALGFSVQSAELLVTARKHLRFSPREHRQAILETLAAAAGWVVLASEIGAFAFTFAFIVPVLIANAVVMSFILTNHTISSATEDNDPLLGALSVTAPRWAEWLTLHFGYHVEHHLFPAVSSRHARSIRDAIVALWPEGYQSMPIGAALRRVFATGRVYCGAATLVDPRTGGVWPALGPTEHQRGDQRCETARAIELS